MSGRAERLIPFRAGRTREEIMDGSGSEADAAPRTLSEVGRSSPLSPMSSSSTLTEFKEIGVHSISRSLRGQRLLSHLIFVLAPRT